MVDRFLSICFDGDHELDYCMQFDAADVGLSIVIISNRSKTMIAKIFSMNWNFGATPCEIDVVVRYLHVTRSVVFCCEYASHCAVLKAWVWTEQYAAIKIPISGTITRLS